MPSTVAEGVQRLEIEVYPKLLLDSRHLLGRGFANDRDRRYSQDQPEDGNDDVLEGDSAEFFVGVKCFHLYFLSITA